MFATQDVLEELEDGDFTVISAAVNVSAPRSKIAQVAN